MFGSYENEADVIDLDAMFNGDDTVWDEQPRTILPPGKYQLRLTHFEPQNNENTGSVGFYFHFVPYAYEDGKPVPEFASEKMKLRKYFYVGKKENGKLISNSFTNQFTEFLVSIGIPNTPGGRKFNQEKVQDTLVMARLDLGEKKLSTRPDPNTGEVPTEIDEDNPNTYVQFLQINDKVPLKGIKDASGKVMKAY